MGGIKKIIFQRQHAYNTPRNRQILKKTAGKKFVMTVLGKIAKNGVKCHDCDATLQGIKIRRPNEFKRLKKNDRTVQRTYGGLRCSKCTTNKIIEETLN